MFLKEVFIPFPNIQIQKKKKINSIRGTSTKMKYNFPFFSIKANIRGALALILALHCFRNIKF